MNKIGMVLCVLMLVFSSGCVFLHNSMKASNKEVAIEKAVASGDEAVIKAVKLDNNGIGVGFDVYNWEAFVKHPVRNTVAGAADAAIAYGMYEGLQSLSQSVSVNTSRDINITGSTDVTVTISGDSDSSNNSTDNSGNGNSRSNQ